MAQSVKNPPAMQTWVRFLGLEDSPGGGHGNPVQYSCLENLLDRGAWRATVHGGHKESDTTEQLSMQACTDESLYKIRMILSPFHIKEIKESTRILIYLVSTLCQVLV